MAEVSGFQEGSNTNGSIDTHAELIKAQNALRKAFGPFGSEQARDDGADKIIRSFLNDIDPAKLSDDQLNELLKDMRSNFTQYGERGEKLFQESLSRLGVKAANQSKGEGSQLPDRPVNRLRAAVNSIRGIK